MPEIKDGVDILLMDGDIALTKANGVDIVGGNNNILQAARNHIQLIYGELDYHPTYGNMMFTRRSKMSDTELIRIEQDCVNAMKKDHRISDVVSIKATKIDAYSCRVDYAIRKYDGTVLYDNMVVDVRKG